MENNKKDLLFYSNYCEYCKHLLSLIIKKNIRDYFILVCVDKKELKIPAFIEKVPSIFTFKRELYTDDDITQYIDHLAKSLIKENDDILPFMFETGINSSQYTFITNDGNDYESAGYSKDDSIIKNNFVSLNIDQKIVTPIDKEADNKSSKFDSAILEKYMNSRKNDDESIKKSLFSSAINKI